MKRRTWILSALAASGGLVVGWSVLPPRSRLGEAALLPAAQGEIALNGWIKITPQGDAVLAMPRSEMGQGVHTAIAMLAAEELDLPLARVQLAQAGADAIYGNVAAFASNLWFHPRETETDSPAASVRVAHWMVRKLARELGINMTGGSSTVADLWEPVRSAAATARAGLLAAAAARWNVSVAQLQVVDGVVQGGPAQRAHYGELAADAVGRKPGTITLKDPKDFRQIGRATPRTDIPAKTNGSARFGIDVRLPGQLFASVRQCPMLGGTLSALKPEAALALPGVHKVVELPATPGGTAGYAVVADTTWQARQALDAVQVRWQAPASALDTARIAESLRQAAQGGDGFVFHERGDVATTERSAARSVEAIYHAPYLAHAALEPLNCTAQLKDGQLQLWMPTQVPQLAADAAARAAGLSSDHVRLEVTLLGGGFGRRLEVDAAVQATLVARQCDGRPVQLIWSREEDTTHDYYRPMHAAHLRASLDASGAVQSLRIQSAGDAIGPRFFQRNVPAMAGPVDTPDRTTAEGLFDLPYAIAHQRMAHVATLSGVPVGFWRSVGHSHNAFFSESFIDELAAATQQDPLQFRLQLLQEAPRYAAVLRLAAERFGWSQALPSGHARGIALHESFGSIVAQAVEVSLDRDGMARVHRVVCAIDCGMVVNPDTVAQQMEGSVVFALTAALYGRIDIQDSQVQQSNFYDYPMLKLAQTPRVQTVIVPSSRAPAGVGEPGVPPLAPAVANALFALTGVRQRSLPLQALKT